jgi:hypothetical protein
MDLVQKFQDLKLESLTLSEVCDLLFPNHHRFFQLPVEEAKALDESYSRESYLLYKMFLCLSYTKKGELTSEILFDVGLLKSDSYKQELSGVREFPKKQVLKLAEAMETLYAVYKMVDLKSAAKLAELYKTEELRLLGI